MRVSVWTSTFLAILFGLNSSVAQAWDSLRLGPEFLVSFPMPIQLGLEAQCLGTEFFCSDKMKYYLDLGYFNFRMNSTLQGLSEVGGELGGRYFPAGTHLFLGMGFGFRKIGVQVNSSAFQVAGVSIISSADLGLSSFYFSPVIGWLFDLGARWSLGFEVGAQVSLISSGNVVLNPGPEAPNDRSLFQVNSADPLSRIAGLTIPKFALLRLVWYLD